MEKLRDSQPVESDAPFGVWLSLREAIRQLGVSAATLRRWADEGRVPSYRTPGGHRRFRVDGSIPVVSQGRADSGRWRLLEYSALGHVRVALEERARTRGVLAPVPPRAQTEYQTLGRELVQLLVMALHQEGQAPTETVARLGLRYAKLHRRYGIDMRTAFGALAFFRRAFMTSVIEFGFGMGDPVPEQFTAWLDRMNEFIDGVAIAMFESMSEET